MPTKYLVTPTSRGAGWDARIAGNPKALVARAVKPVAVATIKMRWQIGDQLVIYNERGEVESSETLNPCKDWRPR